MQLNKSEKGQALILIVFGIVGLVGLTALAVDGGMAYSDRRHAQNAADAAAWAAALAYGRGQDVVTTVQAVANTNGFDDNGDSNEVSVTISPSPPGECPGEASGEDITVQITSHINTYFAPVVGISQVTNTVTAITRSCDTYQAPPFPGNAIVSLAPTGKGFDATGNPEWVITDGGIYSNSTSGNSAYCNGAATITTTTTNPSDPQPGITVAGDTSLGCASIDVGFINVNVPQFDPPDYTTLFPPIPDCYGDAAYNLVTDKWYADTDCAGDPLCGSNVVFDGDMDFDDGLYCVTNSPGPFHGQLTGDGVTFFITSPSFQLKFNGGGNLTATAPDPIMNPGYIYAGVLMYLAPQFDADGNLLNTQAIDLRGNGSADIVGTIIAPSADVTMFGNSDTIGFHSQVIAYQVDTGGGAYINITYNEDEIYTTAQPITLSLLK